MFDDPKKLYFFFDFISHNAYLAWTQLPPLAKKHGLEITPVPVLFAGLLAHYKQLGPAEVPAKARWMLWNILRKAQALDVPLAPPHAHPFNPLAPLRASCCEMPATQRIVLVDRLFRATWAESAAVSDAETVLACCADVGLDAAQLKIQMQDESVKARLRANTDHALQAGVFGVPTMIVRGELFWGFDDWVYLENFLEGRDSLAGDRSAYQAWFDVRRAVERRR